jgi:hypothetical protein
LNSGLTLAAMSESMWKPMLSLRNRPHVDPD